MNKRAVVFRGYDGIRGVMMAMESSSVIRDLDDANQGVGYMKS